MIFCHVGAGTWCASFDGALNGAAGHGVIGDGAGKDITGRGVLHDTVPRSIAAADRRNDIGILKFGA